MKNPTAAFYNFFSFLYPVVDLVLKPQKKILFEEVNRLPEGTLLEIGVGNGSHLSLYQKHKITAIDTSAAMLNIAREKKSPGIALIEMSGESLLFEDSTFDYVVLSHVIAVVNDADQLFLEIYRILKPQGKILILNHFTPDNWLRHVDRALEPVAKSLQFKSFFRIGDIQAITKFRIVKDVDVGMASYFKLFIYQKE